MGNAPTSTIQVVHGRDRRRPDEKYESEAIVEIYPQVKDLLNAAQKGKEMFIPTDIFRRKGYDYDLFSITFAYNIGDVRHEETYQEEWVYSCYRVNGFLLSTNRFHKADYFSLKLYPDDKPSQNFRNLSNISSIKISIRKKTPETEKP